MEAHMDEQRRNDPDASTRYLGVVLALLFIGGCCSTGAQRELEHVAKDWSMTIRASQVIPLYPLTEDVQPGDIFLVQVSVDDQQKIFSEKGFLPLDNHIGRLPPTGYAKFYDTRLSMVAPFVLPRDWFNSADGKGLLSAMNASFPTYSFSVRKGSGLNLAVPVQGVPIGLSLLGSEAAQGSIVIADAKTYGLDSVSLYQDILTWARLNRPFLADFAPSRDKHNKETKNYVRIVSRVYLTSRLNVSLQSSQTSSGGVSGGAPKPVDLLLPKAGGDVQQASMENYGAGLDKLNTMVAEALSKVGDTMIPGGTVKVAAASSNSISLVETFPRPLAIGYLGFDVPIGPYGILGPPIPTHALLTKQLAPSPPSIPMSVTSKRSYDALTSAARNGDQTAATLVQELDALPISVLPPTYPCPIYGLSSTGGPREIQVEAGTVLRTNPPKFSTIPAFREKLRHSMKALQSDTQVGKERHESLTCTQNELNRLEQKLLESERLLREAIHYVNDLEG
jgi:hypothetical protein